MVFHDQRVDISELIEDFDQSIAELGLDHEALVFHTGPLIRKEKGYEYLTRKMPFRFFGGSRAFKKEELKLLAAKKF